MALLNPKGRGAYVSFVWVVSLSFLRTSNIASGLCTCNSMEKQVTGYTNVHNEIETHSAHVLCVVITWSSSQNI